MERFWHPETRPHLNWSFMNRVRVFAWLTCAMTISGAVGCMLTVKPEELGPADVETTLFLIGDAGEPDPRESDRILDSLTAQAAAAPSRSIIAFLGDNVYPDGIPAEGQAEYADARRRLEAQVNAIPLGARGIFLPGNHDWAGEGPFGLYSIRLQERMIASMAGGRDIRMLPGNGCPGPVAVDVGRLRFIALDTQWWLHGYIVRDADSKCPTTTATVTAALRAQVGEKQPGRVTVVAGHHPLMTGGAHGGYCGVTGPFRRFGGNAQDILGGLNLTMRDSLESAFSAQPPLVSVGGHDHNLQVLKGDQSVHYILVSGAGSMAKVECAVRLRESYFVAHHRGGFMRLDIMRGKGVLLRVYQYTGSGAGGLAYSSWLELR
jgi:hypothetical protein